MTTYEISGDEFVERQTRALVEGTVKFSEILWALLGLLAAVVFVYALFSL